MKKIIIIAIIITSITFFVFGFSSGVYHHFPFELINNQKRLIIGCYEPSQYQHIFETDVSSLIKIQDEEDIREKKQILIQFIWKEEKLDIEKIVDMIEKNISDIRYEEMTNLQRIDKFSIKMEHDVNTIAYLFSPKTSNNNLIIYHQGHGGDFVIGKNTIEFFLDKGYTVLAFSMPLYGMNNQPIIDLPNFGKIKLEVHNQFHLLDNNEFTSIKYFMEQILVSLNYIEKEYDFDSYSMVGVSGGGWSAIIYSAIDDRIDNNFSVTGMYPEYLQQLYHPADYERINSQLYQKVSALEFFVMSGYGENRTAMQIFNKFDPGGRCGEYYKTYEGVIKEKIGELGKGEFITYLDDTHNEHKISNHALEIIFNQLEEKRITKTVIN